MFTFTYGVAIHEEEGDFVVSVRDLDEVVTAGSSLAEALELAADAIEVAVAGRMEDSMDLSPPTPLRPGEHAVALPAHLAAKAAVYAAWKRSGLNKSELAQRLDRNEVEVRRILNPRHGTKIGQLEEAAKALGGKLVIAFEPG
ncbi:type II toxin-antitoxin system HicB family antitoxin [Methylobacterium isbiliense]|uniref:Antitoxin HicB n=1 Tax=Methylobacterium isbiliense TaxID=315478 RepID=A0ABQ4SPA6_9HYPH|nr:type II toxin-antitoxin system HicB family antitoxin [Methylobacterium isbiliense]MDN3627151.1 type II toxin-antitoxin system HicB family antitoxin [Methylobacterium isbiliense]GJE03594.1 Antitoxin HicB [Methylobacterium isbiliense]